MSPKAILRVSVEGFIVLLFIVFGLFGEVPEGTERVLIWLQNVSKEVLCGICVPERSERAPKAPEIEKPKDFQCFSRVFHPKTGIRQGPLTADRATTPPTDPLPFLNKFKTPW